MHVWSVLRVLSNFNESMCLRVMPKVLSEMASEIPRCAVLLEEKQLPADTADLGRWDAQVLVLASDEARAACIASGLDNKFCRIEITDQSDWQVARLKLVGASAIILASPVVDLNLLSELLTVRRFRSVPVLVFVDRSSRETVTEALKLGVSAFIVNGLEPDRIPAILHVAEERHALTSVLREQLQKSQEELAARKTIERAKGLLMMKSGLSEQEVYDSMRRMAMTQGKPMREVADAVLAIFSMFP